MIRRIDARTAEGREALETLRARLSAEQGMVSGTGAAEIEDDVRRILDDVRERGDDAVCEWTNRFDGSDLKPPDLRVPQDLIEAAYAEQAEGFLDTITRIRDRVREFQREIQAMELEARRLELERAEHEPEGGGAAVLLMLCIVVHILVAVWIYQDIRQRNAGSGIWIVLGLLAGLLAALVYGVIRLGDTDEAKKKTNSR